MRRLVVFDLDGTITYRDTLLSYVSGFLKHSHRTRLRMAGVVPALCAFAVGAGSHGSVKSAFIRSTLGGVPRAQLDEWTAHFVPWAITAGSSAPALAAVSAHREAGDLLVLMSASIDLYVKPIARALAFEECVCTEAYFDAAGNLTGKLGTNRRGIAKVDAFEALRRRFPAMETIAYGNAGSDLPHLVLADSPRLVNASPRTIVKAAALGIRPFAAWNATSRSGPATVPEKT